MRIIDFLLLKKSTIILTFVLDFLIGLSMIAYFFENIFIGLFSSFNISSDMIHTICYISGEIGIAVIPIFFGWVVYQIYKERTGSNHTILIGGTLGLIVLFFAIFFYLFLFWLIGAICLVLFLPLSIFTIIYNKTHY